MIPGKNPNRVKRIFSQKCFVNPTSKNTPSGGNITASKILNKSPIKLSCVFCNAIFVPSFVKSYLLTLKREKAKKVQKL